MIQSEVDSCFNLFWSLKRHVLAINQIYEAIRVTSFTKSLPSNFDRLTYSHLNVRFAQFGTSWSCDHDWQFKEIIPCERITRFSQLSPRNELTRWFVCVCMQSVGNTSSSYIQCKIPYLGIKCSLGVEVVNVKNSWARFAAMRVISIAQPTRVAFFACARFQPIRFLCPTWSITTPEYLSQMRIF